MRNLIDFLHKTKNSANEVNAKIIEYICTQVLLLYYGFPLQCETNKINDNEFCLNFKYKDKKILF